jgi:chemotaxis protein CheC
MLLNSDQLDALQEVINLGIGNASSPLSELTRSHVGLEVPHVKVLKPLELESALGALCEENVSVVEMKFEGVSPGKGVLAFPKKDALALVEALADEKFGTPDMDSLKVGILTEFGNIILGQFFSSIGNFLKTHFKLCLPSYKEGNISAVLSWQHQMDDSVIILVKSHFKIRDLRIEGSIFVLLSMESLKNLIEEIDNL